MKHAIVDKGAKKRLGAGAKLAIALALAACAVGGYAGLRTLEHARAQRYEQAVSQAGAQLCVAACQDVFDRVSAGEAQASTYLRRVVQGEQDRRSEIIEAAHQKAIEQARAKAVEEAHAKAVENARKQAVEEARAAYDAEVEAERQRRSSDFSDTAMFGDSIMQNAEGTLYAELPGVSIDAYGGRSLEEGPPGAGYDPDDGVLDHIRRDPGGRARYVVGTGNNDAGGMPLAAAEEIIAHWPDAEIYFVTEYVGGNPGGTAATNAVIADVCERYEHVHAIAWYELVSADPGSYLRDGVHPYPAANSDYARLIRETISAYDPPPFDEAAVDFDPASVEFDEASVDFDPDSVPFDPASISFDPLDVAALLASLAGSDLASGRSGAQQGVGAASAGAPASNDAKHVQPPKLTDAIMGETAVPAEALLAAFEEHGSPYPSVVYAAAGAPEIADFVALCFEEAEAEGVRADVLFAQAMHETAWLQFGNQVSAEQCNFGGLGATNDGAEGAVFPDVRTGLRAQVQHLKAYASTEELVQECVDDRFELVERGCATTVFDLGGRWAVPGDTYGDALMELLRHFYELAYPGAGG